MFRLLILIAIMLVMLFLIALIAVGICIGIAQLMIYFLPAIELVNALVPAAILASLLIVSLASLFQLWFKNRVILSDFEEFDEEEDPEPEPPTVTSLHTYRNKNSRRRK